MVFLMPLPTLESDGTDNTLIDRLSREPTGNPDQTGIDVTAMRLPFVKPCSKARQARGEQISASRPCQPIPHSRSDKAIVTT